MRGRLLDRDKDGDGLVQAENGARYEFWRADVVSERGLRFHTPVEFQINDGRAMGIRAVGMSPINFWVIGAALAIGAGAVALAHSLGAF